MGVARSFSFLRSELPWALGVLIADLQPPKATVGPSKDGRPLKPREGAGCATIRTLTLQRPGLVRGEGDVLDSPTVRSPTRAPTRAGGEGASLKILCMRLTRRVAGNEGRGQSRIR